MGKKIRIVIEKGGAIRGVWSPGLAKLLPEGAHNEVRRASHVEPTQELSAAALASLERRHIHAEPNQWWADMSPVGGPVLGPWSSREVALDEEVKWLNDHNIPAPLPKPPAPLTSVDLALGVVLALTATAIFGYVGWLAYAYIR